MIHAWFALFQERHESGWEGSDEGGPIAAAMTSVTDSSLTATSSSLFQNSVEEDSSAHESSPTKGNEVS